MNNMAGFAPDSSVGPLGRGREFHPPVPGLANGGTIGDEFAPWFSFGEGIYEADMFRSVGTLLHVFVNDPSDSFDLLAICVNLNCRPCRAWVGRVTSHA